MKLTQKNTVSELSEIKSDKIILEKATSIWQYGLEKEQSDFTEELLQGPTEDGYQIIFYAVSGNKIIQDKSPDLPSELLHLQQDIEKHQQIWNVFTKLIPESNRNVNEFLITTDGIGGIGGGVNRDSDEISMWQIFYDISDVYPNGIFDEKELTYTTIHEFGHILTSGPEQIEVDMEMINSSSENNGYFSDSLLDNCETLVLVADGCAKENSYINKFYQQFWIDIISEWDEIQYIEDDEQFVEESDLFYEKYRDQFVSMYSSTNIDEDIAESWTGFVLTEKPSGETISEQKILFFYGFPELVELREHIRENL